MYIIFKSDGDFILKNSIKNFSNTFHIHYGTLFFTICDLALSDKEGGVGRGVAKQVKVGEGVCHRNILIENGGVKKLYGKI